MATMTRLRIQSSRPAMTRPRSRVAVVKPVAFLDQIANGFVRIFSPDKSLTPNPPTPSGSPAGFSDKKIRHHEGGRKPFADNFANTSEAAKAKAAEPAEPNAIDYVNAAAQSVVAHNFETAEDRKRPSTGQEGWKSDIPRRKNKPFADDFANTSAAAKAKASEPEEPNAIDYVQDAAKSVVAHNFEHAEDRKQPGRGAGHQGWSGDVHSRDKDGFHSKKM